MPELPEVETIANNLRPRLVGRTITSADLRWERTLVMPTPECFERQVAGQKIAEVSRRAKFLHIRLADFSLIVHLRMSGDLWVQEAGYAPQKHDRLILTLDDNRFLVFNDTRKFGRVWLTKTPQDVFAGLGPEPLDPAFTAEAFCARLQGHRRQIKPLLLDQTFLAGVGNIYANEALHLAGLHPLSIASHLTPTQAQTLLEAIRTVLRQGIAHNGASIDWAYRGGQFQNYFRVHDRKGQPCPTCGTPIQRIVVGQRGTYFCPSCQMGG